MRFVRLHFQYVSISQNTDIFVVLFGAVVNNIKFTTKPNVLLVFAGVVGTRVEQSKHGALPLTISA